MPRPIADHLSENAGISTLLQFMAPTIASLHGLTHTKHGNAPCALFISHRCVNHHTKGSGLLPIQSDFWHFASRGWYQSHTKTDCIFTNDLSMLPRSIQETAINKYMLIEMTIRTGEWQHGLDKGKTMRSFHWRNLGIRKTTLYSPTMKHHICKS